MDSEKLAFWGIVLKPGEPADLDLEDGETLRVTMASYGADLAEKHGRSVVTATIHDREDDDTPGKKYAITALTAGKSETCVLDVSFIGEESVTFEVSGKNAVHLVGNFSFENDMEDDSDDSDEEQLIGVYDDDGIGGDDDSDSDDSDSAPRLMIAQDPPVITELSDEDNLDGEEEAPKKVVGSKKKQKMANGKHEPAHGKGTARELKGKETAKGGKKSNTKNAVKKTGKGKPTDMESDEGDSDDDEDIDDDYEVHALISESESESEDEVKKPAPGSGKKVKKPREALKGGGKGHMDPMEDEDDSEEEEEEEPPKVTPPSGKNKRGRNKNVMLPDEPTPVANKRSKLSQRPGTPAVVKSSHKTGAASSSKREKRSGKVGETQAKENAGHTRANGGRSGNADKTAKEPSDTPNSNGPGSGKQRRRRSRKSGGNA